jgi:ribosomal protein S18 acetylase RimI-like enzyme
VARAACGGGPGRPGARRRVPVRGTRRIGAGAMTRHGRLGDVLVDSASGRTTLDGELLSVPPADAVPLGRLYFLLASEACSAGAGTRVPAMDIEVRVIREVTDEDVTGINRLLPQLSRSAPPLDADALTRVATWGGNSLLIARSGGEIIGMLTLVTFAIPTGLRAWIEDVVVDQSARGQGVGAALTREAVRLARAAGARTVDLTSRPSREAANRLYERLGFELRDTRTYRLADGNGRGG